MATTDKATTAAFTTAAAASAAPDARRVIVVPVSDRLDEAVHLLDWYTANLRSPGDRLVLVRLLVPDWSLEVEEAATAARPVAQQTRYRGGSASSSAVSTSCESTSGSCTSQLMEEQMDRQLEASVSQEAVLVRRLRERGLRSFRFIHAFCKQFTDCLLSIASEQGAHLVLAPLSAFAVDHDLALTYHLYKKARIGVIHVPDY